MTTSIPTPASTPTSETETVGTADANADALAKADFVLKLPTSPTRLFIDNPLVVMYRHEDNAIALIFPGATESYKQYGQYVCDLVRSIANAFQVSEDDVWEHVDRERRHHTSEVRRPS